ncbi:MAG: flagellar hook-length control protein FliK [Lachnospiraceae bacterium]|nr:flagellar hook-length control protein FliK [Lachnospiraceae bacterium]
MEKIQTEAILPIQAGIKTRKYAAGEADLSFDRLLKERNQAAEGKSENASVSGGGSKKPALSGGKDKSFASEKDGESDLNAADIGGFDGVSGENLILSALFFPFSENMDPISEEKAGTEEILAGISGTVEEITVENGMLQTVGEKAPDGNAAEVRMSVLGEDPQMPPEELTVEAGEISSVLQKPVQTGKAAEGNEPKKPEMVSESKPEEDVFFKEVQTKPVSASEAGGASARQAFQELSPEVKEELVPEKSREARSDVSEEPDVETRFLRTADMQPREYLRAETETPVSIPVKTTPSSLVDDVGKTLAQKFPQNNRILTIELEPASLGRLTIKVLYEDGKATVSILSSNPKTLELLSARATELASILEERTGQETLIYTQPSESEQPFDEKQGEEQQKEQNPDGREHREPDGQDSFAQQLRLGLV